MQSRQGNILQSLRGVQQFLNAHAGKLAGVQATGARRRLDAEVDRLSQHAVSREADRLGARGDAFVRRELKNDAPLLAGWDSVRRPPSRAVRSAIMGPPVGSTTSAAPELELMPSSGEATARAA